MSNTDSFIAEVTEEVRRDRLYGYLRRYGWIAVLVVLLIVGGAAWNEWRKARDRAAAEAFGDAVIQALETEDRALRVERLTSVPAEGGRGAVLDLLIAAEAQESDDVAAALQALERLSARDDVPVAYRQMASFKRVIMGAEAIPLAEREAILSALSQPGEALRPLALEQLALLRIEAGEQGAALAILRELLDEPEATQGLLRRVSQLIVALGGDIAAG